MGDLIQQADSFKSFGIGEKWIGSFCRHVLDWYKMALNQESWHKQKYPVSLTAGLRHAASTDRNTIY